MSIDRKTKASHKLLQQVLQQEQRCKNLKRTLTKLWRRAHSPQLTKALSAESTFIIDHAQRLKLIKKLIGTIHSLKNQKQIIVGTFPTHITISKKSAIQDSYIIRFALQLFSTNNKALGKLMGPALACHEELVISLIEQSISENADTIRWLQLILKNVVTPDLTDGDK